MSVFLRNISIKGIKNICEDIELVFAKKEINDIYELRPYNIKAIYGPNGSGKTAIVHAFQVLRDIITRNNYLYDPDNAKHLYELMNKVCKTIEIKVDFFQNEEGQKPELFTYIINIAHRNETFEIVYEKFSKKPNEYGKEKIIVESKNGEFIKYSLSKNIKDKFTNLLMKRSFGDIFLELVTKRAVETSVVLDSLTESYSTVFPLFNFVFNIRVILDSKDDHSLALSRGTEKIVEKLKYIQENQELFSAREQLGYNSIILSQKQLSRYKEEIKKKEAFIKFFKPNIKAIILKSRIVKTAEDEETYAVNEFVDYGDCLIDLEFESIGIKKLMNLYSSLKHLSLGGILIIDELDSHINDVYLVKIIEYISEYSNGQLIFTTHNVSPMETLKSKKNAIDFMSMSGKLTSWTQIGNYSPSKLYKKGMVQGLPFNVDAESFLSVFTNE